MSRELKGGIFWVGKVDWESREFHGAEYSTHKGTSYNSYLIKDEKSLEKCVNFGKEFGAQTKM